MELASPISTDDRNIVLVHDGSFEGFLCALAERGRWRAVTGSGSRTRGLNLPSIRREGGQADLFEDPQPVRRDSERARAVAEKISSAGGPASLRTLREAFGSDLPDLEEALARTARALVESGPRALENLADEGIRAVVSAALRTRMQAHLYAGLVRFSSRSDGWWFSRIEPACDVLPWLGEHFASRFPLHRFVIHDARRDTALIHEPGKGWDVYGGFLASSSPDKDPPDVERKAREAWRRYFDQVAIGERKNPRLQASHLPRKYRRHLPEFGGKEEP